MNFGIFYEHQIPRPWDADSEHRIYREALEQVELADRVGIDYAWEVEHHFLEEYSHSSAPEVFLAACSQRTQRIRLGHGIVLMPPGYNHPARVAERIAALDLVSDGRVEFGTGESASILELGGYRVTFADKRAAWCEALEQCLNMMVMAPYPGFEGKYFSMPCRNVVPKPLQKPHPPVWVACSNRETIKLAAQLGIGALTFAFVDPSEAKQWVDDYYRIIKTECVPIGHSVNANIAMVTGFSVHPDAEEAKRRGEDGFKFFGYALAHHYIFGEHTPGRTDIWAAYEKVRTSLPEAGPARGIGTPKQLRAHLKSFEDAGVDQVAFIQQGGKNRHDHICQSLELFAREVLPEFDEREEARARRKQQELTPFLEQAMMRKEKMAPLAEDRIPSFVALGRQVAETEQLTPEQAAARRRMLAAAHVPLEDPAKALAAD
jgi:alkanesulfonate monooxygenase SsuD/methylene tetrahydromethanopterin reductase-like flavin-dependent oxidoreductase (luciferase family)